MQGRPAKLKLKTWRGKSFAEKPPNETLLCIATNATHAAEKGMAYILISGPWPVSGSPKPDFCFSRVVHPPLGLAPAGKHLPRPMLSGTATARMRHLALGRRLNNSLSGSLANLAMGGGPGQGPGDRCRPTLFLLAQCHRCRRH
jgi:hypothetical protein